MTDLKPCPFCGGTNIYTSSQDNHGCANCPTLVKGAKWNSRPLYDALKKDALELANFVETISPYRTDVKLADQIAVACRLAARVKKELG